MVYQLRTLGRLELADSSGIVLPLRPQDLLIIAYLQLAEKNIPDWRIAETFWYGVSEGRARHSLSQAVHRINKLCHDPILRRADGEIQLVGAVRSDYHAVLSAARRGDILRALSLRKKSFLEVNPGRKDSLRVDAWISGRRHALDMCLLEQCERICTSLQKVGSWRRAHRVSKLALKRKLRSSKLVLCYALSLYALAKRRPNSRLLSLLSQQDAHEYESAIASRLSLLPESRAAFVVGRDGELNSAIAQIASPNGSNIVIAGETGIGKTIVAREILRKASEAGYLTVYVPCTHASRALGYAPIEALIDALEQAASHSRGSRNAPQATTGRDPGLWASLKTFVLAQISAASQGRPLLICFDDVQWADESSRGLINQLAVSISKQKHRMLLVYRTDDLRAPSCREIDRSFFQITIQRLAPSDAAELARRLLSSEARASGRLCRQVALKSDGHPLFIVAMCRSISGMPDGASHQTVRRGLLHNAADTLRDYVAQYYTQIDSKSARLLELMAVAGEHLPAKSWGELSGLTRAETRGAMLDLLRLGVATENGSGKYGLGHDIFREAVYDGLRNTYRRSLHRIVVRHLRARGAPHAVLARHYAASGMEQMAVESSIRGARECRKRYAFQSASDLYVLASSLATSERMTVALKLKAARMQFRARSWSAAAATLQSLRGDHDLRVAAEVSALEAYVGLRVMKEVQQTDVARYKELLASRFVADRPFLSVLVLSAWAGYSIETGIKEDLPPYDYVRNLVVRCGPHSDALYALLDYAAAYAVIESPKCSIKYLEDVRRLARALGEKHLMLSITGTMAGVSAMAGELNVADRRFQAFARISRKFGLRNTTLGYWNNRGITLCERDQLREAERFLRKACSESVKARSRSLFAKSLENLYIVYWERGEFDRISSSVAEQVFQRAAPYVPYALIGVAGLAAIEQGRLKVAQRLADIIKAEFRDGTTGDRGYPEMLVARVLKKRGRSADAIGRLRFAMATCRQVRPLDYLRLQLELACHLTRTDRDTARVELTGVLAATAANGARLLHRRATEQLDRLT